MEISRGGVGPNRPYKVEPNMQRPLDRREPRLAGNMVPPIMLFLEVVFPG